MSSPQSSAQKMLAPFSQYQKGAAGEAYVSGIVHREHVPILISNVVMRRLGLKQIDVAFYEEQTQQIFIWEIKWKEIDDRPLGRGDRARWRRTTECLMQILWSEVVVQGCWLEEKMGKIFVKNSMLV